MSDLNVDPALLNQAAAGITSIISELSELGVGETGAVGRGFSQLTMSAMEAGKANVQATFETFTERWSWGIRALVQSGNAIAEVLDLSAGRYYLMDQQASNTLKEMFTHLAGNPHLTDEEIDKKSWDQVLSENTWNLAADPNYSGASFSEAFSHMGDNVSTLGQVGQYLATNPDKAYSLDTGVAAKVTQINEDRQKAGGQ
ncbi:hypothetical protein ACIO52_04405 [Nocardia sp. NPDC087230]|uniref:hypothetical protein n=1 Tax=Nocardia sp. NPDC087230 TaxID=3364331 RepID=UPI00381C5B7E